MSHSAHQTPKKYCAEIHTIQCRFTCPRYVLTAAHCLLEPGDPFCRSSDQERGYALVVAGGMFNNSKDAERPRQTRCQCFTGLFDKAELQCHRDASCFHLADFSSALPISGHPAFILLSWMPWLGSSHLKRYPKCVGVGLTTTLY